jgi:hypothetical protein
MAIKAKGLPKKALTKDKTDTNYAETSHAYQELSG